MQRTFPEFVGGIIQLDPNIELDPFILTASVLVDEVEAKDTADTLDDERLELIERWLSAHFYCMIDPRTVSEKAGPVSATYETKVDLNLALSRYGQTAMVLDTTGALRAISGGKRTARVSWLGKKCDD